MSFGGVQRWGHGGITVLIIHFGTGALTAEGTGQPLIVPGLTAAVALAVHGAVVSL